MSSLRKMWQELDLLGKALTIIMVCALTIYAATKPSKGSVTVSDNYIKDNGSYLTNDVCRIAIEKKISALPEDTSILVYARELSSTNVADWVRLEPYLTYKDYPYDHHLPNATNYNIMVAADYLNPPFVHTNGVLIFKGFIIPGTNKAAFPNTKIKEIKQ